MNNKNRSNLLGQINKKLLHFSLSDLGPFAMVIAIVIIWIVFEIITGGTFLSTRNFSILMRQMSITGILSIGAVMLIVSGNFDLSVGSVVGLTGGIAAVLQVWYKWDTFSSVMVALIIGVLIGAWHGFWVAYRKVPSFIVTLGGLMIFRGILLVITQGRTIAPLHDTFTFIGGAYIPKFFGFILVSISAIIYVLATFRLRKSRINYNLPVKKLPVTIAMIFLIISLMTIFVLVLNLYRGIPLPIIILLFLLLIFTFIATGTPFGRHIYAIGGNEEAAYTSGIKVKRTVFSVFVVMGLLSAIGGIIGTARLNAAAPTGGTGLELDAIAAAVLGGTSLSGGIGTIPGGILGAIIMASLDNGMSLFNISSYYQYIVKGLILILAVWFDVFSKRRS